ncbi:hypothetical protein PFICI_00756 [Pestalotiopsis fici W106-1]|uniref:Heterokaryon incompatibility domain-containing protein n=1 Tax=Pestalotiopsis fici (strain W106-1 / CGMCC3.15140) TaxID=1229662 RepID=W3XLI4_PESFW|nr:uncharacterized protein PFICI_00756 [Pestalotiopsis fici W106-1]ETS86928.1 hypothetical protein PFICI_00756 [Pestalotiopsis fici W106-1]
MCTIIINGMEFSVTRTLYTTLRYLRHTTLERVFWIDGVCINQKDTLERNHQVAQMGQIYSCARCVRIWLGEATVDIGAAMDLVSASQNGVIKNWTIENWAIESWPTPNWQTKHIQQRVVLCVRSYRVGASSLTKLLKRPYWQRMWVFQEIVLAKRAVVHCGSFEVDWSSFREMDGVMADQRLWAEVPMNESWVHDLRRAFFGIAQFCVERDQSAYLNNVLYPTRNLKCTDPRDKLYALMGVCEMSRSLGFVPDYTRSVCHVYTDFTRSLIDRQKDFSNLLTAGLWNCKNGIDICLPTWVPDYRGTHGVNIRYLAASYLEHFNASKGRKGFYLFQHDEEGELTRLQVRGSVFDTVKNTAMFANGKETRQILEVLVDQESLGPTQPLLSARTLLDSFFRIMVFEDPTTSPETNRDRLARLAVGFAYDLLTAGTPSSGSRTSENTFAAIIDFLSSLKTSLESHPFEALGESYLKLMEEDPEQLHWFREEYLARSRETSQGSTPSFFSTQRHCIGKGVTSVSPGDVVAVIFGCRIPVVLRSSGRFYQLVGPCYVHGAMNGEVVRELGTIPGVEEQDIILV